MNTRPRWTHEWLKPWSDHWVGFGDLYMFLLDAIASQALREVPDCEQGRGLAQNQVIREREECEAFLIDDLQERQYFPFDVDIIAAIEANKQKGITIDPDVITQARVLSAKAEELNQENILDVDAFLNRKRLRGE